MTGTQTRTRTRTGSRRTVRIPPGTGRGRPSGRLEPGGSFRLTGRGAVVALFGVCFLSLLLVAWTGWGTAGYAMFVCGCGAVTYYTRASGLRTILVCPPLLFLAACVCVQALTASGGLAIAEGILVTLGSAAPWLFTGTALTVAIAYGRGFRLRRRQPGSPRAPR
jgi:hypothetical protein